MFDSLPAAPSLETVDDPFLHRFGVRLQFLRLDKIHPLVHGNKWFKLKNNLSLARQQGYSCLLSFGGAYSNHLRALAAAANLSGLQSIGIVRGEIPDPLNPALAFARQQGMELHGVSRSAYRRKREKEFLDRLQEQFGHFYLIPEGGSNEAGVAGCQEIMEYLIPELENSPSASTTIAVACGTGATLAGLIRAAQVHNLSASLLGIAVLKGADFLNDDVRQWLPATASGPDWQISQSFHYGGYARSTPELREFIAGFQQRTGIPLEPVYTGKLVAGVYRLIQDGQFEPGCRIICLHTGGIY